MSAAAAPRAGGRIWLLGLACGIGAALAPATLALAGILLAPAMLAWLADPRPGKTGARPVILAGAAGAATPLLSLWSQGHHLAMAMALAADTRTLALAWSVQGGAWLAVEALPHLIRLLLDGAAGTEAMALRRSRATLEAAWGIPRRDASAEAGDAG